MHLRNGPRLLSLDQRRIVLISDVDMRMPNTTIQRERHIMPKVKDLTMELSGVRYFSKMDLQTAYHQLELKPESRYITTFSTHEGLYQYSRLNYGTNSAAEIFQTILQ